MPLNVNGFRGPFAFRTTGAASIAHDGIHLTGAPGDSATVVAASPKGIASTTFSIGAPPSATHAFIAVASYDDGIVIHDADPPFTARSVLGIGGAAADIAIGPRGTLASADTDGVTATLATLDPWNVRTVTGVSSADELTFDERSGALFVTDRDVNGNGAITRVAPDGTVARRVLGLTSEGLALDARRGRVYVANVNDGTVSVVDTSSLRELQRFPAVPRVFSLALSSDGKLLYAVSNQSVDSPFAQAGSVTLFRLDGAHVTRLARSGPLQFPIGIVFDEPRHRIYVTDESTDEIDVLDSRTLRAVRAPLRTCEVPWKPTLDGDRLYVPCARSNRIDVFDTRTLSRVSGAPFATGGYPLAVAVYTP